MVRGEDSRGDEGDGAGCTGQVSGAGGEEEQLVVAGAFWPVPEAVRDLRQQLNSSEAVNWS